MAKLSFNDEYHRGDFVFGKLRPSPWWPAIVLNVNPRKKEMDPDKYWIFWFGEHKFSQLDAGHIINFRDNFEKCYEKNKKRVLFSRSVEEALRLLVAYNNLKHLEGAKFGDVLVPWALKGFKGTISFQWKNKDFPEVVKRYLKQYPGINIHGTESENENERDLSDMEVDDVVSDVQDVISDVREGRLALEDICIACASKGAIIKGPHPLFVGGVCMKCYPDVEKVIKMGVEKEQDFCIVCGNGGKLVICSNAVCLRSYCEPCLRYFISENAFDEVVQTQDWFCFYCKNCEDKKCLIKRRMAYVPEKVVVPTPLERMPINVISNNHIGLLIMAISMICAFFSYYFF